MDGTYEGGSNLPSWNWKELKLLLSLEEQLKGKVQEGEELAVTKNILTKATEDNRRELNEVIKKAEQIIQESMKKLKERFEQEL